MGSWDTKPTKWYDGGSWVTKPLKWYNGSSWVTKPVKVWVEPPPSDIWPDPGLANTATANWVYGGNFGAVGGTGPGITILSAGLGDFAYLPLSEADGDALNTAWADNTARTVTLTIANFVSSGDIIVGAKDTGAGQSFSITSDGDFPNSVTAGEMGLGGAVFTISGTVDGASFDITNITVE
jgi:hypothetical protein